MTRQGGILRLWKRSPDTAAARGKARYRMSLYAQPTVPQPGA